MGHGLGGHLMPHPVEFVDADVEKGDGTGGGIYAGSWAAWRRESWREMSRWTVTFLLPHAEPFGDWLYPFGKVTGCELFVAVTDDFGTLVRVPK